MSSFLVNAAAKQIDAGNIAANAVGSSALQDNAVTTAKIDPLAITLAKIAAAAQAGFLNPLASTLALVLAETNSNVQGFLGDFYLADDFESDSLATKTNSTYDAAGDYYGNPAGFTADQVPVMTSNTAPSGVCSRSGGTANADVWNIFDAGPTAGSYFVAAGNTGWFQYQFTSAKTITRYVIAMPAGDTDRDMKDWTLQGSSDGSTFTTLDTVTGYVWAGRNTLYYFDVDAPGSYTYYRVNVTLNYGNGSYYQIQGMEMFEAVATANQTFAPTAATLTTANPTDLAAWLVISPQEAITAGTDIVMTASIDGGTTDATGTWTKIGDITADGRELWRVDFDVSAQTGSSLTWEITTANTKEIRLNQLVGIKAFY